MSVVTRTDNEVVIAIARDAALVRTARLVAAAVARRADLSGALIEEVRLGVGEACAILIGSVEPGTPHTEDMVHVGLRGAVRGGGGGFVVEIRGTYQRPDGDLDDLGIDPWALLRGVTDDVVVDLEDDQATVTMTWPA